MSSRSSRVASSGWGTHAELIATIGHCVRLWAHQSGGFLTEDVPDDAPASTMSPAEPVEDWPLDEMTRHRPRTGARTRLTITHPPWNSSPS
jgi:hypothetical protein